MAGRVLRFPPFSVDLVNERLWRDDRVIPLRPKTFAVLRYLLQRPGQLVNKEELLQAVWADVVVTETVPRLCIRELRQALEDDAQQPRFIETQPRRGYRFIASITTPSPFEGSQSSGVGFQFASATPRTATRVVGRDAELTQLMATLDDALKGQRQMVFVTGEPGIGKTALVETFLTQGAVAHELWIAQGQCIEHYGTGEAYLPVLEALERLGRAMESGALRTVLRRHAATWLVHLSSLIAPSEREELRRQLTGTGQEHLVRELAQALEALTAQQPLVLWLEDLHWSDPSTLSLLAAIARRPEPARLLVIATYRPGDPLAAEHRLRRVHHELQLHGYCSELALSSLSEAAVAEYLTRYFAVDGPSEEFLSRLAALIHQRTEGNPLFMVTVLHHLITQEVIFREDGDWKLTGSVETLSATTPSTVRQFLEQQLDRLRPSDQHLLEVASIAGMEFSAAAVAAACERPLPAVEERCTTLGRQGQFVRAQGSAEWPDGTVATQYCFRHALHQAVLYERIPAGRRIECHRRIGERLERAYGDRAREIAAALAMHFEYGRYEHRAVGYLQQAGENAVRRSAHPEAISYLTRGLELLKTLPETREHGEQELQLQLSLGIPLAATRGYAVPEVERAYARARQLCGRMGDTPWLFPALVGLWGFYLVRGELQTARELASQGLRIAEQTQNTAFLLEAHVGLGLVFYYQGDLAAAHRHLDIGAELTRRLGHRDRFPTFFQDSGVACLTYGALMLWHSGLLAQARARMAEAVTLARLLSHPFSLAYALNHSAGLFMLLRDRPAFCATIEEAVSYAQAQGFPLWVGLGTAVGGWALIEQGQTEEGIARIRQGLSLFQGTGTELGKTFFLLLLADSYGRSGQTEEGFAILTDTEESMQKTGERLYETELYRLKGELTLQPISGPSSDVQVPSLRLAASRSQAETAAEAYFLKAITVARRQKAKSLELRVTLRLARLWQQLGKRPPAQKMLAKIYGRFTESFEFADLKDAKALLEELAA